MWQPGESYRLRGHSFALFINRAPAPLQMARGGVSLSMAPSDSSDGNCSSPKPAPPEERAEAERPEAEEG